MEEFAACIKNGKTPTTSGMNGLHVVEMLESAVQSLNRRGHPVELAEMRRAS
jgi:hypothetical protein